MSMRLNRIVSHFFHWPWAIGGRVNNRRRNAVIVAAHREVRRSVLLSPQRLSLTVMKPERRRQVEQIYHSTLEREESQGSTS